MKPLTRYEPLDYGGHMEPDKDGQWYAKDEADAVIRELELDSVGLRSITLQQADRIAELEAASMQTTKAARILMRQRDAAWADAERNRANAERYEYLRRSHWSDSPLCVVSVPKENTILGADLPSGDRLDAAIDAARGKE